MPSAANLSTIWASLPQIARSEHLHRCRTCMHHEQAEDTYPVSLHVHWLRGKRDNPAPTPLQFEELT